jgi:hypothetical protein
VKLKNVLGGLAMALAIAAVAAMIPDLKRYIRISTM